MIRSKVCRKDWHLSGKRPQIGPWRKTSNLSKVSSVFNVCLSFTKQVNYKVSSIAKILHFCYRQTIRLRQENFSCHNKTNYSRRHKFLIITHKNTELLPGLYFSRSRNDQPLFVNEDKYSRMTVVFAKKQVSGFRRAKHKLTSFKQIQTILHDFLLSMAELDEISRVQGRF